ncbi:SSU ribosomal protein S20p [Clostridiaceae bacterium JG1575]|nr:SSU ribosomal protein S20p [Clostridiaceae bacterium JG1575]
MANIKSAIKRIETTKKKTLQNKSKKSALKTTLKKYEVALAENAEQTEDLLKDAVKSLDKAASKGLIHKNAAARKKSRLIAKLHKAQAVEATQA